MERLSDLLCFSEKTDDFLSWGYRSNSTVQTGWADSGVWNAGADAVSYIRAEEALQSM